MDWRIRAVSIRSAVFKVDTADVGVTPVMRHVRPSNATRPVTPSHARLTSCRLGSASPRTFSTAPRSQRVGLPSAAAEETCSPRRRKKTRHRVRPASWIVGGCLLYIAAEGLGDRGRGAKMSGWPWAGRVETGGRPSRT